MSFGCCSIERFGDIERNEVAASVEVYLNNFADGSEYIGVVEDTEFVDCAGLVEDIEFFVGFCSIELFEC
jgi:hypothetical protein